MVGKYHPTIIRTEDYEVAVKKYEKDDFEVNHYHKMEKEITVIIEGEVIVNNVRYSKGDIIVMEPGETTDFKALTDTINVVVKIPSAQVD